MAPTVNSASTISVITPSYNQAVFLPRCLDSVSSQTIRPVEHFVFDPGSSDGSIEIALARQGVTLINESDEGQSDALNKGFLLASGDIIAWLNSDDYYWDETVFATVLDRFNQPDAPDIVYGRGNFVDIDGSTLREAYVNSRPETFLERFQQECGVLRYVIFQERID